MYNSDGTAGSWAVTDATSGYFTTGAGSSGITWGPLSAPSYTNAQTVSVYMGTGTTFGQPCFAYSGSNVFPSYGTGNDPPQVYFVDLEATPVPVVPATVNSNVMLLTGFPL